MTDWRETLFIWDGILGRYENDHNDNKNSGKDDITWKGTWIGYSNAADATEGEQMKGSTFGVAKWHMPNSTTLPT